MSERGGEKQTADLLPHVSDLVVAGWTGRDRAAVEHHIQELAELGVKRPKTVPCYYRLTPNLLTLDRRVQVIGSHSSGEVEIVLFGAEDGLWVGLGSDHTDRRVEAYSVTVSKQLCVKPVGSTLWRYEDVAAHWDRLVLRSRIVERGVAVTYQEGTAAAMQPPGRLMADCPLADGGRLRPGAAMFCGTLSARGGVRPSSRFEMELEDPVLGRRMNHSYEVVEVPIDAE